MTKLQKALDESSGKVVALAHNKVKLMSFKHDDIATDGVWSFRYDTEDDLNFFAAA